MTDRKAPAKEASAVTDERRHVLKTWPAPFNAVWGDLKTFEVRKNDRDYQVGDVLELREFFPDKDAYSGRVVEAKIQYMLTGGQFGISDDFCVMAIKWRSRFPANGDQSRRSAAPGGRESGGIQGPASEASMNKEDLRVAEMEVALRDLVELYKYANFDNGVTAPDGRNEGDYWAGGAIEEAERVLRRTGPLSLPDYNSSLSCRLKSRLDFLVERAGSTEAAVTGRGVGISYMFASQIYRALLACSSAPLHAGWRDIASAPKDEVSPFLVLAPAYGTKGEMVVMQASLFEGRLYPDARGAAIDWEDGITNATHWMPLPSAPVGSSEPISAGSIAPDSPLAEREAVIEECAVLSEDIQRKAYVTQRSLYQDGWADAANECVEAIRSLKSPPTAGRG